MKTFISVLLSLAMAISGFFGNIFSKSEKPVSSTSVTDLFYVPDKEDIKLFNAVNEERRKNGVEPLQLDPELCRLATVRAQDQLLVHGHTRPNGTRFITIFNQYDYKCNKAGENIVILADETTYSSQKIVGLWLDSPSHKSNMLNDAWVKTGIAVVENKYCVQLFVY